MFSGIVAVPPGEDSSIAAPILPDILPYEMLVDPEKRFNSRVQSHHRAATHPLLSPDTECLEFLDPGLLTVLLPEFLDYGLRSPAAPVLQVQERPPMVMLPPIRISVRVRVSVKVRASAASLVHRAPA